MRSIEMETFEVAKFLELASEAETIRVNEEQFAFLRGVSAIADKMWTDTEGWMIFDADIKVENPVDESAPRNIVFEMFEFDELTNLPFIFHKQTILHNPPYEIGNCMQTCIAGLLGKQIHEVPHFGEGFTFDLGNPELRASEGVAFIERVKSYLKSINYRWFEVLYDTPVENLQNILKMNEGIPMIVSGQSKRGTNHSVIMYNGETYDPHPANNGLIGPLDNGYFAVAVLVKIPGYFAKEI